MKVAPLVRMADCLLGMAAHVGKAPLVVLLSADHDAERLALLARGAFPHIPVLCCPATDALPGDGAGASAVNAGQRVAALTAMGAPHDVPPILICGAEATIAAYPPPEAFVAQPPLVKLGDQIDLAELREQLIAIGYRADERIDEPGEVGDAGAVLNVYPVDAQRPVRIELEDGRVRSLRRYDPLSQTTLEEIERASFGIASAPPVPKDAATLLAHAAGAMVLVDPGFANARARLLDLAKEIDPVAAALRISAKVWDEALSEYAAQPLIEGADTPRFAGKRRPIKALETFLAAEHDAGRKVVIAGSARDVRFFARRLGKLLPDDLPVAPSLIDALAADAARVLVEVPIDEVAVRAALLRENARAGQSFVVVPRIDDLPAIQALLAKLVPDLEVITVHSKMGSAEADEALIGFAGRRKHILLATSIIENGLDVPRANTMVIAGCDRFGVGQLHQLRGRVGRSARRGHVLMMSAPGTALTEKTRARLNQLVAHSALGAGFAVAANDLDMRGAGDLTGDDQSGHLKLIGLELYQTLLTHALRQLAGEEPAPPLPKISTGEDALLPDDWIVDSEARIAAYVSLARIGDTAELDRFADELEDRYGALPAPALTLLATQRLALSARDAGIALQPGAGQRVSDERIIADRRADTRPIEDAANALDALIGDAA